MMQKPPAAAMARLTLYAATIGQPAPAALVDRGGAPSRELLDFCKRTGASLDWIFCGDVRAMIRDSFARASGA
jgi:hypothetical protein